MHDSKLHFLLSNGAAYNVPDHFLPLITRLLKAGVKVTFIQHDYYLSAHVQSLLLELSYNPDFNFEVVALPHGFKSHIDFLKVLKSSVSGSPNLVLLTSDCTIWDRYLIKYSKRCGIKVGLLQTNLIHIGLLKKARSIESSFLAKVKESNSDVGLRKTFDKIYKSGLLRLSIAFKRLKSFILDHVSYPMLLGFGVFFFNRHDKYSFCAGRTDFVLCRSAGDCEVFERHVGYNTSYQWIRMPTLKPFDKTDKDERVLFLPSNINSEMSTQEVLVWCNLAKKIANNTGIKVFDLRIHPRTNPGLKWPMVLKKRIEKSGFLVKVGVSSDTSITESASRYKGFVCAFSGAARICSEQSDGFVICVMNASGRKNEEGWMLGDIQGIEIIQSSNDLDISKLTKKRAQILAPCAVDYLMGLARV